MTPLVLYDEPTRLWPESGLVSRCTDQETELEHSIRTFLTISAAVHLTSVEERTLLDVTPRTMALLRLAPGNAYKLGGSKLERRVSYATAIVQRMIAAMAS